jgi:arylsulfatase A
VVLTDLFHTLTVAAGLGAPAGSVPDGLDLSALLRKPDTKLGRDALFFHYPHDYHAPPSTPVSAVRVGNWKLLEFFEDQRVELFNLQDDPGESRDLAKQMPAKTDELRQRLRDWRETVGAQMPASNAGFKGGALPPK